jgi:hypothetical protein
MTPHRICNFSGGLCSFFAAKREVDAFGPMNCTLLFADTLVESKELYAFNQQASAFLGVPITRVSLEITPWQLFRKQRMIGNNRFPICSIYLKRELLNAWMVEHFEMDRRANNFLLPNGVVSMGFDWTEEHRTNEMRNEHPTWEVSAPMQEGEIWDKCRMQREAAKLGFATPDAYKQGFPHHNCGKRCVRAGISHWVHLFHVDRPAYEEWESEEWDTAIYLKNEGVEPFSMLKDRRGGETKNLYLRELRARIESGELFDKHDWGGCGCGGAAKAA